MECKIQLAQPTVASHDWYGKRRISQQVTSHCHALGMKIDAIPRENVLSIGVGQSAVDRMNCRSHADISNVPIRRVCGIKGLGAVGRKLTFDDYTRRYETQGYEFLIRCDPTRNLQHDLPA